MLHKRYLSVHACSQDHTNDATLMQIATWNVNSLRVRIDQLANWLKTHPVDVMCIQETKIPDDEFPLQVLHDMGYHAYFSGEKGYNGVAILSRRELNNIETELDAFSDPQRRFISATLNDIRIVNIYAPNGRALDSDKFHYKRQWFTALTTTLRHYRSDKLVLLGDFNIAPTDLDVHDPAAWRGKIHCSDCERMILHKLMSLGLYDSFRHHHPENDHFSWWNYRDRGYDLNHGLRIDLILVTGHLLQCLQSCEIDEKPRSWQRPSDHAPVITTFQI